MPAPSTTDWPAVKATAIARNSLKEAAALHNVPHGAVRQRACREKWPVGRRLGKAVQEAKQIDQQQLAKINPKSVTSVTSTADALVTALADDSKATRAALATTARIGSEHFAEEARKTPGVVMDRAKNFQQLTSAAGMIGGWGERGQDQAGDMLILSIGGNVNLGGQHVHSKTPEVV